MLLLQDADLKRSNVTWTVGNVKKKQQKRKHLIVILSSSSVQAVFLEVDGIDFQSKIYEFLDCKKFLQKCMNKEIWGRSAKLLWESPSANLKQKSVLFVNEIKGSEKKKCVAVQPTDTQFEHEETFQCIYTK